MNEEDREYTIRIDTSLSIEDITSTILHEMVHVHQYITGRLRSKWVHEVTFERVVYPIDMIYEERPWEIEAAELEERLMEKYSETKTTIRQGLL